MFEWIKIIHVISSAVLLGAGAGSAFYFWFVNRQSEIQLIANAVKQVVFVSLMLIGISGIIQFITGLLLVFLKSISPVSFWIIGSALGYFVAAICWVFSVYLQIRCRDLACDTLKKQALLTDHYHRYYKMWFLFSILAFVALLCVLYLMVNHS